MSFRWWARSLLLYRNAVRVEPGGRQGLPDIPSAATLPSPRRSHAHPDAPRRSCRLLVRARLGRAARAGPGLVRVASCGARREAAAGRGRGPARPVGVKRPPRWLPAELELLVSHWLFRAGRDRGLPARRLGRKALHAVRQAEELGRGAVDGTPRRRRRREVGIPGGRGVSSGRLPEGVPGASRGGEGSLLRRRARQGLPREARVGLAGARGRRPRAPPPARRRAAPRTDAFREGRGGDRDPA